MKVKKNWFLCAAVCGILSMSDATYGQSLKDILNSSTVKNAVTAVTGGKTLTTDNLTGTWTYANPAIQLESDNTLKNVAGSVASSGIEEKLQEYCAKVGIVEGSFTYTFNSDGSFTNVLKNRTLSGTYTLNSDDNTLVLNYASKLNLAKMTANVVLSDDQLSLLFNADKLLDFLSKLSSISSNSTLQTLSSLAEQYDGMMMGFELKK